MIPGRLPAVALAFLLLSVAGPLRAQPNIVVILADDLGWNDVGFHGSNVRTPNLDQLAADGIELTSFRTAPMCSPTRAGLLTGRHPIRMGLHRTIIAAASEWGLPSDEITIAEALAVRGYRRRALIGKWHLGHTYPEHHPLAHGFTEFYGLYTGAIGYYDHRAQGERDWHRDYVSVVESGYVTDLLTDEAIRFISASTDEPFFLFLSYTAPHWPNEAPPGHVDSYADLTEPRRTHAAMVTAMDDGIGRVLEALRVNGIDERTIVLFASDNGADTAWGGDNSPLRGGKGNIHEGAVRVPALIRWPGTLQPGLSSQQTGYLDVLPTLLDLAGLRAADNLDGISVAKQLLNLAPPSSRYWFTLFGHPEREQAAVHLGDWKLVRGGTNLRADPNGGWLALYDLSSDVAESTDIVGGHRQLADSSRNALAEWLSIDPGSAAWEPSDIPRGWQTPPNWDLPVMTPEDRKRYRPVLLSGIFPNPSGSHTTVRLLVPEWQSIELSVFNLLGRRMLHTLRPESQGTLFLELDSSHLPQGVYLIRIDGDLSSVGGSFVVAR